MDRKSTVREIRVDSPGDRAVAWTGVVGRVVDGGTRREFLEDRAPQDGIGSTRQGQRLSHEFPIPRRR